MKPILLLFSLLFYFPGFSQGTLQFNQVLLVSSASPQTVGSGKVWKVVNAYAPSSPKFSASSGSGSCGGSCNGSSTRWTSFTVTNPGCPSSSDNQLKINGVTVAYSASSPLWLPAGAVLQGNIVNCTSTAGYFDGQGYSCFCPPSSVSFTVSVIEFNIVP
ncbi:MAG: hypothetical protein IT223_10925 [Crocinitomicaceae bacterium]|nr:hypothetical protein [Crocinitomicaceae bacterium]